MANLSHGSPTEAPDGVTFETPPEYESPREETQHFKDAEKFTDEVLKIEKSYPEVKMEIVDLMDFIRTGVYDDGIHDSGYEEAKQDAARAAKDGAHQTIVLIALTGKSELDIHAQMNEIRDLKKGKTYNNLSSIAMSTRSLPELSGKEYRAEAGFVFGELPDEEEII